MQKQEAQPSFTREVKHGAFVTAVASETHSASDRECHHLHFVLCCVPKSGIYQLGAVVLAAVLCMQCAAEAGITLCFWVLLVPLWLSGSLNAVLCHVRNHKSARTTSWPDEVRQGELVQGDQTVAELRKVCKQHFSCEQVLPKKAFGLLVPLRVPRAS